MYGDSRGVSEVVGAALIVGIVVTLSLTILLVSTVTLSQSEAQAEFDSAAQTMTKFDSQASLTGLEYDVESSPHDFSDIQEDTEIREDTGWMRITVDGPEGEQEIMNESFNSVTYTNDDANGEISYEAGGVWQKQHGETEMVSPPEFHFRDRTITVPMLNVDSDSEIGSDVQIERSGEERLYPIDEDDPNPLEVGEIEVTVQSDYYEAWGQFFATRTESTVEYDHENEKVHARLEIPLEYDVEYGMASSASGETITFNNNIDIYGYDSSEGDDPDNADDEVELLFEDDVVFEHNFDLNGSVVTSGEVLFEQNNARVMGDVRCPGADEEECVGGDNYDDDSVQGDLIDEEPDVDLTPANHLINNRVADFADENDNADVEGIDDENDVLDFDGEGEVELNEGQYYLSNLVEDDMEGAGGGAVLDIDATDGDVDIAVDGDIDIDDVDIEVDASDEHRVEIYTNADEIEFGGVDVNYDDYDSTNLWIYGKSGTEITFNQQNNFVGVIYAPGDEEEFSYVEINNNPSIYGGIVANVDDVSNNAEIYYDNALRDQELVEEGEGVSFVTYLHVSTNEITIED